MEYIQEALEGADMEVLPSFYIPKEHTVEAAALQSPHPFFAQAKVGRPTFRIRSAHAYGVLGKVWEELPHGGVGARSVVEAAVRDRFFVDGGTECTLGRLRKAYPRVGATIRHPVTQQEAERALDNCGLRVDTYAEDAVRPYPLIAREGEGALKINPKSDNGFPVLGQWQTPGAAERVMRLAVTVRKEVVAASRAPGGVREWKRRQEDEAPWLVACRGKAKADYYGAAKVEAASLRFYNALPRQVMLNMQVVTQPMEALSRSILEGSRSGIGMSLVHGGANEMVEVLEEQLIAYGWAYVHVGDDSWVVVRGGAGLVWFALDCSNFDLTQHSRATEEVHRAVHRQLRLIDAPAADLWYEYARERVVVVAGALVRRFKHAGPSGMPLQSKVNDMLMDVLINRVLEAAPEWGSEAAVNAALEQVGSDLGFSVRVEQYASLEADSIKEALAETPFLFVGYYFYARGATAYVCGDVPRTLSQLPYPSLKWMRSNREVLVYEAMRLGCMFLSAGIPPRELRPAFEAWRLAALELIDRAVELYGDVESDMLVWVTKESPWAPVSQSSLGGLRQAVVRDAEVLWVRRELPLPSTSDLVLGSWADEMEAMEAQAVLAHELYIPPPAAPLPAPAAVRRVTPATHPPTSRNDGRPPPTARWGPPRPPRAEAPSAEPRRHGGGVRRARRGRVLEEDSEEEFWEEGGYSE